MKTPLTLITGATGLVGNNVARYLIEQGEKVRLLVRNPDDRSLQELVADVRTGDVCDVASVQAACNDATHVIHAAGYVRVGWANAERYQAVNIEGTRNVAQACRTRGIRMVHVSTTDVYGGCSLKQPSNEESSHEAAPPTPYMLTKRAAERVVADESALGLDAVIVQPAFMLGPWDWKPSSGKLLLAVARGTALLAPRGWFSLCDVRDVAHGIVAARDRGVTCQRYILGGKTMPFIEAFRLMADVCGVRRPWFRAGPLMVKIGGWYGDAIYALTKHEMDVNSASVAVAALPKNYSSQRAFDSLNYSIRPTEETVHDAWRWFQEHAYC